MSQSRHVESALKDLLASQQLAVLATSEENGRPYANLMAFAATEDLKGILLVTGRATRKYANLTSDPRVALLIDSRSNREADVQEAVAVTVIGEVEEVQGPKRDRFLKRYLSKHPHLEGFATSPTCALLRVRVKRYYLVRRFQEVTELRVR